MRRRDADVLVRVVDAGDDRASARVDAPGRRSRESGDRLGVADGDNALARESQSPAPRAVQGWT